MYLHDLTSSCSINRQKILAMIFMGGQGGYSEMFRKVVASYFSTRWRNRLAWSHQSEEIMPVIWETSGDDLDYVHFGPGDPNGSVTENCLVMRKDESYWGNCVHGANLVFHICEKHFKKP